MNHYKDQETGKFISKEGFNKELIEMLKEEYAILKRIPTEPLKLKLTKIGPRFVVRFK